MTEREHSTTYPDPDDATAAKRGSDYDRAEAWRILAQDMRAERDWLCRQLANFKVLPGVVQAHDLIGGVENVWKAAAERHVREGKP